ncbi:MAG: hypothetical protein BWY79_01102 [Actinobacteria bacterium ADurb.Bin444]|nr:MAG: hypothetical protein BWY79_01102 [Actinobacteria bacterium ADurb.Bin444]
MGDAGGVIDEHAHDTSWTGASLLYQEHLNVGVQPLDHTLHIIFIQHTCHILPTKQKWVRRTHFCSHSFGLISFGAL